MYLCHSMFCYKMYKLGLIEEKLGLLITKQTKTQISDPVLVYLNFRESYFLQDDVIKWKQFPRYWPFVWGIHRSPGNSPHKGQWRGALMFSLISAWTNGWVNNREAGDLRRHHTHYDVTVMLNSGPLPTKAYTTLVPKFEKHPLLRDFGQKNPRLFQQKSLILRLNKTPLFKAKYDFFVI